MSYSLDMSALLLDGPSSPWPNTESGGSTGERRIYRRKMRARQNTATDKAAPEYISTIGEVPHLCKCELKGEMLEEEAASASHW